MLYFNVTFQKQDCKFDVKFSESKQDFDVSFESVQIITDIEVYQGDYNVIPKVEEQTLQTANRLMKKDVTIIAIPYYEVSNNSGGSTVYIAKEIE